LRSLFETILNTKKLFEISKGLAYYILLPNGPLIEEVIININIVLIDNIGILICSNTLDRGNLRIQHKYIRSNNFINLKNDSYSKINSRTLTMLALRRLSNLLIWLLNLIIREQASYWYRLFGILSSATLVPEC